MKRLLQLLLLLSISTSIAQASGIGISPASFKEYFEPGMERTYTFTTSAFGDQKGVRIYLGGELQEYATTDKDYLPNGGKFSVTLTLPQRLEQPGTNTLYVGVIESGGTEDQQSEGVVETLAAVRAPIRVFVPYPGKYIESTFNMEHINEGEQARYEIEIDNLGTEDIFTTTTLQLYEKENLDTPVLTTNFNRTLIKTQDSLTLQGLLATENLGSGEYKAYVIINYGEEKIHEKEFNIGKQQVNIIDYDYVFEAGRINPMNIIVKSEWNSKMEYVHAEVTITKEGQQIDHLQTASIPLEPWAQGNLTGFLDATNITQGRYLANIIVHYEGGSTSKLVAVYIIEPEQEKTYTKEIIIGAGITLLIILLIAIILIIQIIRLKKKLREHETTKK